MSGKLHYLVKKSRRTFSIETACGLYGSHWAQRRTKFIAWVWRERGWQKRAYHPGQHVSACTKCVQTVEREMHDFRRDSRAWFLRRDKPAPPKRGRATDPCLMLPPELTARRPYDAPGTRTFVRGLAAPLPPENACGARGYGGTPSDPDSIRWGKDTSDNAPGRVGR